MSEIKYQIPILRADPEDAFAIADCTKAAYRRYIPQIGKPPAPMLDDFAKIIDQHQAFVVKKNQEIIALLILIRKEDVLLLDNLAVRPTYQGKGLGRRLIVFAEAKAKEWGYRHIDLYTNVCMTENIKMYTRLGFTETKRLTENGYQRVYMRKILRIDR